MYLSLPAGSTSKIIQIPIFDSASSTGALLTGLLYNSAGLSAYYNREGASGAATAIPLVTATKGTYASGGFVAVDATNMPGWYELHLPNAALDTGAKSVAIHLKGATNMVAVPILIELTATSNQDGAAGGMSTLAGLPNAAAVKAQAVAALVTDTYAEPTAVPAATASLKDMVHWMFTQARNKVTQTANATTVSNDGDTATIATSADSLSGDGQTFTRGKFT